MKELRIIWIILGALSLAFLGCAKNPRNVLSFKTKESEIFESPANWLWNFDGSIEDLRKGLKLRTEDMFYIGYKFSEIGNWRQFEEALLYTIDNTKSILADLSACALLEYWQSNRLYGQIALYGGSWKKRFDNPMFILSLAEAFYWQGSNEDAWEIFEKIAKNSQFQLTDEHLLFRTVLALRLGKSREAQSFYQELITQLPASSLHDRLWQYLLLSPEEADLLTTDDQLLWLKFKSLVLEGKVKESRTLAIKLARGVNKDWLLNIGLVDDFVSLYSKEDSIDGTLFLREYYSNSASVYLAQAKAALLAKEEKWEEALPEYKIGLRGAIDKPLDRVVSYYYAYLRALSLISIDKFVEGIQDVPREFLESNRFSRVFDIYLNELVEKRDWEGIHNLYLGSREFLSSNYQSRLDFLMARLIEHHMITIEGDINDQKSYFYNLAMKTDPLSYGSFMAHYFTGKNIREIFPMEGLRTNWETDKEINQVISGFLEFGLANDAYRLLQRKSEVVSAENYLRLAELFGYQDNWFNSIEVMTRLAIRKDWNLTKEELKVLYPEPYVSSIRYWAANYGVSFPVRMGQIHNESRFDSMVRSPKNAVGISQLLESTANQIANELNTYRYSITNPEDNIRFGTFYLAKRFKQYQSGFKALLAYNAGYVRLNEWEEMLGDLPDEIYIEAVPFWESRRYIRSILLNAGIYTLLYGNETDFVEQVVKRIFKF